MTAIMTGCAIVFFFMIPLWRKHPVFFMLAGGFGMITACYMAEVLNRGITNNISIAASLMMICFSLVFWGFGFAYMYISDNKPGQVRGNHGE